VWLDGQQDVIGVLELQRYVLNEVQFFQFKVALKVKVRDQLDQEYLHDKEPIAAS